MRRFWVATSAAALAAFAASQAAALLVLQGRFIWDEYVYVELAGKVLRDLSNPHPRAGLPVPHPPLFWYYLALAAPYYRLAMLPFTALLLASVYAYASRAFGREVGFVATAATASSYLTGLFAPVIFTDAPSSSLAAASLLVALAYVRWGRRHHLAASAALHCAASLTKYPVAVLSPASLAAVWLATKGRRALVGAIALAGASVPSLVDYALFAANAPKLQIFAAFSLGQLVNAVELCLYLALATFPWVFALARYRTEKKASIEFILAISLVALSVALYSCFTPVYDRYIMPGVVLLSVPAAKAIVGEGRRRLWLFAVATGFATAVAVPALLAIQPRFY